MRISAIAPVGRLAARSVDPISWYEASSNVVGIDPNEAAKRGAFKRVMEKKLEEDTHVARTRVLEVVFAPGVSPGYVQARNGHR